MSFRNLFFLTAFTSCLLLIGWIGAAAPAGPTAVSTMAVAQPKKSAPLVPPACVFAGSQPESALNTPCRVSLQAIATDDRGAQAASEPVTIYLLPADRWPLRVEIEGDKEVTLQAGQSQTLLARVWDQHSIEVGWPVRWRVSQLGRETVATVGEFDGVVRGLTRGEALVTAIAQNISSRSVRVKVR